MASGDHLAVWCSGYWHHGIEVDGDQIVHLARVVTEPSLQSSAEEPGAAWDWASCDRWRLLCGESDRTGAFEVQRVSRQEFEQGRPSEVVSHRGFRFPAEQVAERALGELGRRGYHLYADNCEHFAAWCVTGRAESRQVRNLKAAVRGVGATLAAAAAARVSLQQASRVGVRRVVATGVGRACGPWLILADAVELGTQHLASRQLEPEQAERVAYGAGLTCSAGVGLVAAGPIGAAAAAGLWAGGRWFARRVLG